jgi:peptidoglycan hydrolase-like protein with peptidoglycan-binding domain
LRSTAYVIALALCTALAVCAVTPASKGKTTAAKKSVAKKTKPAKSAAKSSPSSGKKSASAKQSTSTRQASSKKTAAKKTSTKKTASGYRRSTQREPDPERYKEIQQSLSDKGYFAGPVNGTWGSGSVEALKRFQRDQNIDDDGKLGSLSLIALGLGPKRGGSDTGAVEKPASPDTGGQSPP